MPRTYPNFTGISIFDGGRKATYFNAFLEFVLRQASYMCVYVKYVWYSLYSFICMKIYIYLSIYLHLYIYKYMICLSIFKYDLYMF